MAGAFVCVVSVKSVKLVGEGHKSFKTCLKMGLNYCPEKIFT